MVAGEATSSYRLPACHVTTARPSRSLSLSLPISLSLLRHCLGSSSSRSWTALWHTGRFEISSSDTKTTEKRTRKRARASTGSGRILPRRSRRRRLRPGLERAGGKGGEINSDSAPAYQSREADIAEISREGENSPEGEADNEHTQQPAEARPMLDACNYTRVYSEIRLDLRETRLRTAL